MRRTLIALLATAGLAGCSASVSIGGGLDTAKLKRAIEHTMLVAHGIRPAITCPKNPKEKKGVTFTCLAHLAVGGSYPVVVRQTTDDGHVVYATRSLHVLDMAKVRTAIAKLAGTTVVVHCPASVLQRQALDFTCTATATKVAGAKPHRVDVTQTDGQGAIHLHIR
jgi:hypothetical protein